MLRIDAITTVTFRDHFVILQDSWVSGISSQLVRALRLNVWIRYQADGVLEGAAFVVLRVWRQGVFAYDRFYVFDGTGSLRMGNTLAVALGYQNVVANPAHQLPANFFA